MADDGPRLYLGTRAGLIALRLTPAGWDAGTVLWRDRPISALAVDPAVPERIHISVYDDGIYRSEDRGRTWERYLWAELHALAVRPDRPDLVYAGGEPAEVYRSTDRGSYWKALQLDAWRGQEARLDRTWRRVRALAFDPSDVGTVYAGIEGGGIVATFDGGGEWAELAAPGLPEDVQVLLVRPSAPDELLAGTPTGLYRFVDRGRRWSSAGTGLDEPNVLALCEVDGALLAAAHPGPLTGWWSREPARLYRLAPGEETWRAASDALDGAVYAFAAAPERGPVYAATTGGTVLRSLDGGGSWDPVAAGLPPVRALAVA